MNTDLQNALYETWPQIFRQKDLGPAETSMCWGIQGDDGWAGLVDALCEVTKGSFDYGTFLSAWRSLRDSNPCFSLESDETAPFGALVDVPILIICSNIAVLGPSVRTCTLVLVCEKSCEKLEQ